MTVGLTVIELPAVAIDPPQEVLYQFQYAPGLKLPPVGVRTVDVPGHIDCGVPEAAVAGVDVVFTVTTTEVLLLTHCNTFHDKVTYPFPD